MRIVIELLSISPYIRYVNHYIPNISYVEKKRILYDFELMYVLDGSTEMHYDGSVYQLEKGDVFFLEPFVENYIVVKKENGFHAHCIHFDFAPPTQIYDFSATEFYIYPKNKYIEQKQRIILERPIFIPNELKILRHIKSCKNSSKQNLALLFPKCYFLFLQDSVQADLLLKATFLEILAELKNRSDDSSQIDMHPKVRKAISWMNSNYANSITTGELADRFKLSSKYFGHLFLEATGMTVTSFLLKKRLQVAKELLYNTDKSIGEISELTGFSNQFYFSKCFHNNMGISPKDYRKKGEAWFNMLPENSGVD